jgi:hypothetical protein
VRDVGWGCVGGLWPGLSTGRVHLLVLCACILCIQVLWSWVQQSRANLCRVFCWQVGGAHGETEEISASGLVITHS